MAHRSLKRRFSPSKTVAQTDLVRLVRLVRTFFQKEFGYSDHRRPTSSCVLACTWFRANPYRVLRARSLTL